MMTSSLSVVAAPTPKRVPWLLMKYQRRWLADKSRVKVFGKSRQIGISWCTAGGATLTAAKQVSRHQWFVGYTAEMAQGYISDCGAWALRFGLAASACEETVLSDTDEDGKKSKDILAYRIRLASGYSVTALSSRPRNLRSKKGDLVIDEAAYHDDLPGLLKAANAFMVWGGSVSIISTYNGTDNDFYRLVESIRAGKHNYSLHECTFDQALEQGLYKRICLDLGHEWSPQAEAEWRAQIFQDYGDDANEELLCIPANSGGIYLTRGIIEAAMVPAPIVRMHQPDEFVSRDDAYRRADVAQWCEAHLKPLLDALPKTQEHYLGVDFGRVDDLSVLAPITLTQDMTRKIPFLVELRNTPFLEQAQIVEYVLKRMPKLGKVAMDSTGNGQFLGERIQQLFGKTVAEAVWLSQQWYAENLPKLKAAFEDSTIKIPRDSDVASDLGSFRVIDGVPKLPKLKVAESKSKSKTRHGDSAIAIALSYYASLQGRVTIDYRPVKPVLGYGGTPATLRTRRGAYG